MPYQNLACQLIHLVLRICFNHSCPRPPRPRSRPSSYCYSTIIIAAASDAILTAVVTVNLDCAYACHWVSDAVASFATASDIPETFSIGFGHCYGRCSFDRARRQPPHSHQSHPASESIATDVAKAIADAVN